MKYLETLAYIFSNIFDNGNLASALWIGFLFLGVPLVVVFLFAWRKTNRLWMAPIVSVLCNILLYIIQQSPAILTNAEAREMLLFLFVPIHAIVAVLFTAVAYGVLHLLRASHK